MFSIFQKDNDIINEIFFGGYMTRWINEWMNDKLLIGGYNKWMNECVVERNGWMLKMENWMDAMTQEVVNNL